jgi:hypothetical protein
MSNASEEIVINTDENTPVKYKQGVPSSEIKFDKNKRYMFCRIRKGADIDPENIVQGSDQVYTGSRLVDDMGLHDFDTFCLDVPYPNIKAGQQLYLFELGNDGFPEYLGVETILDKPEREKIIQRRMANNSPVANDNGRSIRAYGSAIRMPTGVATDTDIKQLYEEYKQLSESYQTARMELAQEQMNVQSLKEKQQKIDDYLAKLSSYDPFVTIETVFKYWFDHHNPNNPVANDQARRGTDRLFDMIEKGFESATSAFAQGIATGNGAISQKIANSGVMNTALNKFGNQPNTVDSSQPTDNSDNFIPDNEEFQL